MIFATLMLACISLASFGKVPIADGTTNSNLGKYIIETSDEPVIINGEELNTFVINYEKFNLKVTVAVKKSKDKTDYIVLSNHESIDGETGLVSVQYTNNKDYFGVETPDKSLKVNGYQTSLINFDKTEYFRQRVLTIGKNSDTKNLKLIAVYFPVLINYV